MATASMSEQDSTAKAAANAANTSENFEGRPEPSSPANAREQLPWGRTADTQKVFRVPRTEDMLHNLFANFPPTRQSHNVFELVTLAVVFLQSANFLLMIFLYPLQGRPIPNMYKSDRRSFVAWCRRLGCFDREQSEKSRVKWAYDFVKREFTMKMGSEYDYDTVPLEFNSWLLFRHLVDFILVNDFTAYLIFALTFFQPPGSLFEIGLVDIIRYVGGIALMAFNFWVKMDAHRVVKDFAWYWGDFFFLIDSNLTFDGVFEMCFHPMYSVGYLGYYGISMITNSYIVLFASLAAHAAQFIFLYAVEEPHINKIYGSSSADSTSKLTNNHRIREILYGKDPHRAYFRRDLIVFKNFDWFRASDLILAWAIMSTVVTGFPLLSSIGVKLPLWFFLLHAYFWRIFHTCALGVVLDLQSKSKFLTKHFIKYGGTNKDAFTSWKTIYNFSMTMCYTSFIVAAGQSFAYPADWNEVIRGPFLLRQVLGCLMILMHIWMSFSVFDVLGDFGWFYGDFFINEVPGELNYTGIYRYLNNPEKTLGLAAFWGLALISGNRYMFLLAVCSHISNWWFLEYVESPHMERLYGAKIRKESGVEKTIRKQLALPVRKRLEQQKIITEVNKVLNDVNKIGSEVVSKVERLVLDGVGDKVLSEVEKVVEKAKPAIEDLMSETKTIVAETTARLATLGSSNGGTGTLPSPVDASSDSATVNTEALKDLDVSDYSLELQSAPFSPGARRSKSAFLTFDLGEPISVYWTATAKHNPTDWIGVYKVTENPSKAVTTCSSKGRWMHVGSQGDKHGKLVFSGDKLPWEVGVYEFRYHFNNKYLVVCSSQLFEVRVQPQPILDEHLLAESFPYLMPILPQEIPQDELESVVEAMEDSSVLNLPPSASDEFDLAPTYGHPNSFDAIISVLLPLYKRSLDFSDVQPTDHFVLDLKGEEKHARRISYGIKLLFGIEFSWKVISNLEPTAERMVERIQEARIALAPVVWDADGKKVSYNKNNNDNGNLNSEKNIGGEENVDGEVSRMILARHLELIEAEKQDRGRLRRRDQSAQSSRASSASNARRQSPSSQPKSRGE